MRSVKVLSLAVLATTAACASTKGADEPKAQEQASAPAELVFANSSWFTEDIVIGGQPTEAALELAKQNGVTTVINLRTPAEKGSLGTEEGSVQQLGMTYVSIPVAGGDGITLENAKALAAALKPGSKTMVHCGSGNRVGALFALKAFHLDGKSVDEAIEIGKRAGMTKLEVLVRKKLSSKPGS